MALCSHKLRRHRGRSEEPLRCDGKDKTRCCAPDRVLLPGALRWSCEPCDFDLCEGCAAAEPKGEAAGEARKQESYEAMLANQELYDAMFGDEEEPQTRAAPRLRKQRPKPKATAPSLSAEELREAEARAQAAADALLSELQAEAPGDAALREALASGSLEALREAIGRGGGSAALMAEARKARDRLKKKAAKKGAAAVTPDGEARQKPKPDDLPVQRLEPLLSAQ
ncbi:hypothetical protein AB1Y20_016494 [Prymnesium parvum]|uniref:ZZ-type domain-containing protein n=1 Tax=Prymnesium parvum TaxID=97485 RepID=A0AB34ICY9_PRYPA